MKPKTPNAVLDQLINGKNIRNDSQLARELGVAPQQLTSIRAGRMALGDSMRVKIMRKFGLSIWDLDDMEAL